MNFQLVLQFPGDSDNVVDAVITIEDQLTEVLGDSVEMDGYDVGSGKTNIFIYTSDPASTFARAKPVLEQNGLLKTVVAAYRDEQAEDYTNIWPAGSKQKFAVL
jgi:hypothetical protein